MKCPNCGFNNQPGAKFCSGHCGGSPLDPSISGKAQVNDFLHALVAKCSTCGNDNEVNANFCRGCGSAIVEVAVSIPASGEVQEDNHLDALAEHSYLLTSKILQERAKKDIQTGGGWLLGGAIFTGVGYLLAPGGWYIFAFGPMIFGGYQMLRGLINLYSSR